ncbi:polynucleotide 5'-hydroxyl-kinase NOL9 [Chelonus insularis]|uniref:polynucleotide 5'-hydroxyl-kinase NOL9 n=1 Tax=Chelonus insularis TaxID=460826 RepID=UPI0015887D3D|nr:polynucleotide 5'-hydroxyl-kinase NOL9 [Chelonus insularis]
MKLKSDIKEKLKRTSTNGYGFVTTKSIYRRIKKSSHAGPRVLNKKLNSLYSFSDENETRNVKQDSKFNPTIITMDSESSSLLTPSLLLRKDNIKPTQSMRIKNSIVRNFKISSSTNYKNHSKITVAQSIIPDSIEQKLETEELLQNALIESDDSGNCINNNSNNNTSLQCITKRVCDSNSSDKSIKEHVIWPIFFYSFRNKVICVMQSGCKFSFHGKLKIQILYGAVEIYGATLDHSNTTTPRELYSPRGTSFIEIRAIQSKTSALNDQSSMEKILKKNNLDPDDVLKHCNTVGDIKKDWAIFILQNFDNNLITFLEEYFSHKLFPSLQDSSDYSWTDRRRAEFILQAHIFMEDDDKKTINVSNFKNVAKKLLHKWEVNKNMRALMAGGKNVGKSTNMRYLVNKLLEKCEKVIVLDLDPGQSEFTPPGCISLNIIESYLLGPNFTHLQTPYYQTYVGGVNVTSCLANYIQGVKILIDCLNKYLNDYQQPLPVVVNTMGFCKNIGWDIMCYTIKCIKPTDVIQIKSSILKNNFERLLSSDTINNEPNIWSISEIVDSAVDHELHNINSETETKSRTGEIWNIEPHQQREIAMLSYLSQIVKKDIKTWAGRNTLLSINAVIPYEVPFDSIKISLEPPTTTSVLSVINGNIVALCGDNIFDTQQQESSELQSHYPKVLSRAPLTTCYGFGIIRGVDMEKKKIYVNTPLSISMLSHVNCLIGCTPIPVGLLNLKRFGIPYTRGECDLPTSQDPRRGYFRMRHKRDTTVLSAE